MSSKPWIKDGPIPYRLSNPGINCLANESLKRWRYPKQQFINGQVISDAVIVYAPNWYIAVQMIERHLGKQIRHMYLEEVPLDKEKTHLEEHWEKGYHL